MDRLVSNDSRDSSNDPESKVREIELRIAAADRRIALLNGQKKVNSLQSWVDKMVSSGSGEIDINDPLFTASVSVAPQPETVVVPRPPSPQDDLPSQAPAETGEDTPLNVSVLPFAEPKATDTTSFDLLEYSCDLSPCLPIIKQLLSVNTPPTSAPTRAFTSELYHSRSLLLWHGCSGLDGDWEQTPSGDLSARAQARHAQINAALDDLTTIDEAAVVSGIYAPDRGAAASLHVGLISAALLQAHTLPHDEAELLSSILLEIVALLPTAACNAVTSAVAGCYTDADAGAGSGSPRVPVPAPISHRALFTPSTYAPALARRAAALRVVIEALARASARAEAAGSIPDSSSAYVTVSVPSPLDIARLTTVRTLAVDRYFRGASPLALACSRRSLPIALALVAHGADPRLHSRLVTRDYGLTPLELAPSRQFQAALLHAHARRRVAVDVFLRPLGALKALVHAFLGEAEPRWRADGDVATCSRSFMPLHWPLSPPTAPNAPTGTRGTRFLTARPNALLDRVYSHVPRGPHAPACTRLLGRGVQDLVNAYFSVHEVEVDEGAELQSVPSAVGGSPLENIYGPPAVLLSSAAGSSHGLPVATVCSHLDDMLTQLYRQRRRLARGQHNWGQFLGVDGERVRTDGDDGQGDGQAEGDLLRGNRYATGEVDVASTGEEEDEASLGGMDLEEADAATLKKYVVARSAYMGATTRAALYAPRDAQPAAEADASTEGFSRNHALSRTVCACGCPQRAVEHGSDSNSVSLPPHSSTCPCASRCCCRYLRPQPPVGTDDPSAPARTRFLSPAALLALAHDLRLLCAWTVAWQAKERAVRLYRRRARDTDAHSPIAAAGAGARGALPSRPITVPVSADAIVARRAAQASIGVRSDEHQAITSPLTLEHVDAEAVSMPSPPARGPADADTQPLDWYVRSSQAVSTHALIYGPVPAPGPAPMHLAPEWVVDTAPWQPRDVDIEDDGDAGRGAGGDGLDEDRYGNDGKTDPMTIGAGAYYEKYDNAFNKSTHPALHKRFQDVVVAAVATCLKQGVVATRAQVLKQEEDLVHALLSSALSERSVWDVMQDLFIALDADADGYVSVEDFEANWNHLVQGNTQRRAEKGLEGVDWWTLWTRCRASQNQATDDECVMQ